MLPRRGARAARGDARAGGRARRGPRVTRSRPNPWSPRRRKRRVDLPSRRAVAEPGAVPSPAPAPLRPAATERRVTPPRANPVWTWFTSGNVLTRIGVVVMFFGVAFLLKYFAEHFTVSIEVRLAAVAAFGVALIALGLRLAAARPGYGAFTAGRGGGSPLPVGLCGLPSLRRAAGGTGHRPARRRGGAHDLSRGARRFAAARRPRDRRRLPRARAGRQRRRSAAAVRLLRRAERGDLRARMGRERGAPSTRWASSSRSCWAPRGDSSSTMPRITRSCSRSWRSSSSSTWRSRSSTCVAHRSPSRTRSTDCWSSASLWPDSRCRRRSCASFPTASRGARL